MRRILVIQYGDYAEAYDRFASGGEETYRDQLASVRLFADLAPTDEVTTVAINVPKHDRLLAPNLRSIGLTVAADNRRIRNAFVERISPTHVILRSPHLGFIRSLAGRNLHILPMFADLFVRGGSRTRLRNYLLRRALSAVRPVCVANHSLNASRSLATILGCPSSQVVPWDHDTLSVMGAAKRLTDKTGPFRLFYVGALSKEKGLGDLISAMAQLRRQLLDVRATIVGAGDPEEWRIEANREGLEGLIQFRGVVPNAEVRREMAEHDAIIVPSRHEYAEGMPNSIYEGLASRTPLVISDHPAFLDRIPKNSCLTFRAGDPQDLAQQVIRLLSEPDLYAAMSAEAETALNALPFGMNWSKLIQVFLDDPDDRSGWVAANSLAALLDQKAAILNPHSASTGDTPCPT